MVTSSKLHLSKIAGEKSLRFDVDFLNFRSITINNDYLPFSTFFDIIDKTPVSELPSKFQYCEIGNVDKRGLAKPVTIDEELRNEINEPLFKKIEKGDIFKPEIGNILISSVRPNLKKFVYIDETNQDVYFTKAFLQLRPKKNGLILYYLLRSKMFDDIVAVSRQGKGYPTLKADDLALIRISHEILKKIESDSEALEVAVSKEIVILREVVQKYQEPQTIIDAVLAEALSIDIHKVIETDTFNKLQTTLKELTSNNPKLRTSYRWNKLHLVQEEIFRNTECSLIRLGGYIQSTKNGWSPNCNDTASSQAVLGIDAIKEDGTVDDERLKFTDETKSNLEDFIIQKGDFFVSRGNTINLVAMAAIMTESPQCEIIFPDLMIKIELKDGISKKYLAYIFNSIVGRLNFKYTAKGKNQTMVKISADELNDFLIPLPTPEEQEVIASKIESRLEHNQQHLADADDIRLRIENLIEKAFK